MFILFKLVGNNAPLFYGLITLMDIVSKVIGTIYMGNLFNMLPYHSACPHPTDCRVDEKGKGYTGIKTTTKSGKQCQQWTSQKPHAHGFHDVSVFPDSSITEAHNYCRNPNGKIGVGPWCYTTDPAVEWESCEISMCAASDGGTQR